MARSSEPVFNITRVAGGLILANVLVHLVRQAMPPELDHALLLHFGFVPSEFLAPDAGPILPENWWAWLSPVSYGFLHGDFLHLLVNTGFLLAFGTLLERRLGAGRMLALYLVSLVLSVAGASVVYWITAEPVLMIGASGAVAGLFGAAARFAFPERRGFWLGATFIGINLVVGLIGLSEFGGVRQIAWEAHVAGFLVGALVFPLLDRPPPLRPVPPPA